jgi:hypothetical protein
MHALFNQFMADCLNLLPLWPPLAHGEEDAPGRHAIGRWAGRRVGDEKALGLGAMGMRRRRGY